MNIEESLALITPQFYSWRTTQEYITYGIRWGDCETRWVHPSVEGGIPLAGDLPLPSQIFDHIGLNPGDRAVVFKQVKAQL